MIVRDFNKIIENERDRVVSDADWTSIRMLLADDKMGFSFHITFLNEGSEHTFEYKNHFESVYCMKGKGSITDLATGAGQARPPHAARRGGAGDGLLLQPARDRHRGASRRRLLRRARGGLR